MAGSSSSDDENPVPVNATALIDVIFCLVIFFMCSFHFKQLEGRMESWLPKDAGQRDAPFTRAVLDDIRVILEREPAGRVVTRFGTREVAGDAELSGLLVDARAEHALLGRPHVPVTIDAQPGVPWKAVVGVLDVCSLLEFKHVELTGAGPGIR